MAKYRFVFLNLSSAVADGKFENCADDLSALNIARTMCARQGVDIWRGERHVGMVKLNDAVLNAQDRASL